MQDQSAPELAKPLPAGAEQIKEDLRIFLGLLLGVSLLAVLAFRGIESRYLAGVLAGCGFLFVGVYLVYKTYRWPNKYVYLSFYFARIHLYLFALPMMLVRMRFSGRDFSELHFLSLSGPQFHRISEYVFICLVVAVIVDRARMRRAAKVRAS